MTGTYDWNPMPHKVDIKCPACAEHSVFEFAEVVKIALKKDVPFFEQSDLFEYYLFKDSCGHNWHGATYYANLHGGSTAAIRDLPEGYVPENWNHLAVLTAKRENPIFCNGHQTLFTPSHTKAKFCGHLIVSLR